MKVVIHLLRNAVDEDYDTFPIQATNFCGAATTHKTKIFPSVYRDAWNHRKQDVVYIHEMLPFHLVFVDDGDGLGSIRL